MSDREDFEEFAINHYYLFDLDTSYSEADEEYNDSEVQVAWEVWQAASGVLS
jgi:hypothetical protein